MARHDRAALQRHGAAAMLENLLFEDVRRLGEGPLDIPVTHRKMGRHIGRKIVVGAWRAMGPSGSQDGAAHLYFGGGTSSWNGAFGGAKQRLDLADPDQVGASFGRVGSGG